MQNTYFKVIIYLLKEKLRKYIHPDINKNAIFIFNERKRFYSLFIGEDDLVFDVGANMGNRVEIFLNLNARVIAFEPQDYCYSVLKFKFSKNIKLIKCAVGSKKETSLMYINSKASTISSLSKEWITVVKNGRFKNHEWNEIQKVQVETLDNLIYQYGVPKFIKIDVEGFENEVLKGLSQEVKIISFEYTIPEQLENVFLCLIQINKISKNYLYNFSLDETNAFVLPNWLNYDNFLSAINSNQNLLGGFGDIYAKL